MKKFLELIDKILIEIDDSINDKIISINYLEKIKFQLIDQINKIDNSIINNLKLEVEKNNNISKKIDFSSHSLIYNLKLIKESTSKIKSKIANDLLTLVIEGSKNLSIIVNDNQNKTYKLVLLGKMGVVISRNTTINENISKNSIILDIKYI